MTKDKLAGVTDEVGVLHPLLNSIFPQLPHIRHVEYTHGPNEKGADFVLEKDDPTLGDVFYIGVVVKTGKIHQDITDIERQIDECRMGRFIRGGTKKILLNMRKY